MKRFLLSGCGEVSKKHISAIGRNDFLLIDKYDPLLSSSSCLEDMLYRYRHVIDYLVICSPNQFHYEQIKLGLKYNKKIIVEKPMVLPWEPIIDNDNINIVLQLRWMDLPKKANKIEVTMVRDHKFFDSWKGNPKNTGGIFHLLFIHYIDLAERLNAKFIGKICNFSL